MNFKFKKTYWLFIIVCVLLLQGYCFYFSVRRHREKFFPSKVPHYQTVVHKILKLETEFNNKKPDLEILDKIIHYVKIRIAKIKKPYTKDTATIILSTIGNVIDLNGFNYKRTLFLNEALQLKINNKRKSDSTFLDMFSVLDKKKCYFADCDTLSLIYLAVGDALDLPLELIWVRRHAFVRFKLKNNEYIDWEATKNKEVTSSGFNKSLLKNIKSKIISSNNFIKIYNLKNLLAYSYEIRGFQFYKRKDYNSALKDFLDSCKLFPDNVFLYKKIGMAYIEIKEYSKGAQYFTKFIQSTSPKILYKDYCFSLMMRAFCFVLQGDPDSALKDTNILLDVQAQTRYKAKCVYKYIYLLKGLAYLNKKSYDDAIKNLNKFWKCFTYKNYL